MAETCHGCAKEIAVSSKVMGVFGARKPSYGSPATYWHELYDGQIMLVFHPECMQKMWEAKVGEQLPEPTTHARTLS